MGTHIEDAVSSASDITGMTQGQDYAQAMLRLQAYKFELRPDGQQERNTSRTCPECKHVSADNRKTQARFMCAECGFEGNADVVGAINVLRAGHARLACELSGELMPPAAGTRRSDSWAAA